MLSEKSLVPENINFVEVFHDFLQFVVFEVHLNIVFRFKVLYYL